MGDNDAVTEKETEGLLDSQVDTVWLTDEETELKRDAVDDTVRVGDDDTVTEKEIDGLFVSQVDTD